MSFSPAEPDKYFTYRFLEIKFVQILYYSGKFQMFYQKAAVMDTLVLKPCSLGLYAPLRIHPSGSGLLLVKFWNCQSHITCKLYSASKSIISLLLAINSVIASALSGLLAIIARS